MIEYRKIKNKELKAFAILASDLFLDTYKSMLTNEQIEYMNDLFFSSIAVKNNMKDGYIYEYILVDDLVTGFMCYKNYESHIYLSKLYLNTIYRGKGIAKEVLVYLQEINKKIVLNVNKDNIRAINFYMKNNFKKTDSIINDIGNGFVMDDYIMTKEE